VRKKIGECLVQAGLISEENLQAALADHKRTGERLGAVLVRMNLASEKQITKALAYQLGFPFISLVDNPPDPSVMALIPKDVALKRVCVAVKLEKNLLTVAMSDPLLFSLVRDLEFQTGHRIKQVVTTRTEILEALATGYPDRALVRRASAGPSSSASSVPARAIGLPDQSSGSAQLAVSTFESSAGPVFEQPEETKEKEATGPIIDLVNSIVQGALERKASDVHIEPMEHGVLVRHRLDGLLQPIVEFPKWAHDGVVARVKVLANLDIAEKRVPQDGRIRLKAADGDNVDFRVSTLRTLHGEKIVLRILDSRKGAPPIEELGMSPAAMDELRYFLRHQHGVILVVGPTGSGKTTTLASALTAVKSNKTNVITVEDPVEYQIPGVNQTQVNERAKVTFATALRAILRQDPDVVLVGEIRDRETAGIAMQAALTGHLVLSTLHTENAPSTVTRLTDMGMEPYLIASSLIGVVAQRLVRKLCTHCRTEYTPSAAPLRALNIADADAGCFTFYRAVGCDRCGKTGYRGRIGIYEIMRVTDKMRRLISQGGGEAAVRDVALEEGMLTLGEDGLTKVKAGLTTPDELLRVVTEVQERRTECPGCKCSVGVEFVACPSCGRRLGGGCRGCGRSLQSTWRFCPFCTTAVEDAQGAQRPATPVRREAAVRDMATFKRAVGEA